MGSAGVAEAGAVLGAIAVALVLLPRARLALLGGIVLLAAAEATLGASLLARDDVQLPVASPARLALALCGALAIVAAAAVLVRFPTAAPVLLLLAAPIRIPISVGGDDAFLLLPLYASLAAAALALAYRTVRGEDLAPTPRLLAVPAALFVALSAISLLWSQDVASGTIELAFFLFPFALLVAVLARTPFRDWLPGALVRALVVLACALSAVGFWQLWSRELFFAPDLEAAQADTSFFRVTSVFKDPNVYGRYLVVAIVVLLVGLWVTRLKLAVGVPLIALFAAALYFTYSQSSLVALFVGILAVTLVAADSASRTIVIVAAIVLALVGAGFVVATGQGESLRRVTSGRSDLVANTTEVIRDHPFVGVGVGAELKASRERARAHGDRLGKASHTSVLTVAAELGILGVVALGVLLVGAVALFARVHAGDEALGLGLGAAFLVVFVHALFYSGFVQDPLTWGTMGVAAAAIAPARRVRALDVPPKRAAAALASPAGAPRRTSATT